MSELLAKLNGLIEKNRKNLLHAPEIFVFSKCLGLVQEVVGLLCRLQTGEIEQSKFEEKMKGLLSRLTFTAEFTSRFDVLTPVTGFGQVSDSFWRWFNWWNDYRKTLTHAEIDHIERLAQEGDVAVNNHRPEGDWLTHRKTPAFVVEITIENQHEVLLIKPPAQDSAC